MSHNILRQDAVAATDVTAYTRSAWSASALDNGWIFTLEDQSSVSGYSEVWDAKQPTTGSLIGLWMAAEPQIVLTDSKYLGLDPDPRNYEISASKVFTAIKPQVGDVVTITKDALNDETVQAFAIASATNFEFTWADAAGYDTDTMAMRYLETTYQVVGSGSAMGDSHVVSYKFEIVQN